MTRNPWYPVWYVAQSDGNTLSAATRQDLRNRITNGNGAIKGEVKDEKDTEMNGTTTDLSPEDLEQHLGLSHGTGHWASCISAVDPLYSKVLTSSIELTENEAALTCVAVPFQSRNWEAFLAVGTGQHMQPGSGVQAKGYVHIYRLLEEGKQLEYVHKTEFETPIYALLPFQGRLALGVGPELFIYDMGKQALLRKVRGNAVPNQITSLQAQGNRIVAADVSESATYIVYKKTDEHERVIPFADDVIQRWCTATTMLDYETTAGGDKFGNLWVVKCPEQASQEADEQGMGGHIVNERSYLGGAPYRLELRAHFFCQDVPMSMQRTALVAGGQEVLFWSGLQGTLGILIPFLSREDVDFFSQLENQIRAEEPPIAGRDHLMYRGYYVPVKGVIDGDLCERFARLGFDARQKIAAELEREPREVERKVQEMRTRVAF